MLRAQATKVKAHVELLQERKLCFDTVLQVPLHTFTLHEQHVYFGVLLCVLTGQV